MSSRQKKVRFGLEQLGTREVPASLGPVNELPDAAVPVAEIARTMPAGPESLGKVQMQDFHFTKVQSYDLNFSKVQFQDFNFTMKVNKASPKLFLS